MALEEEQDKLMAKEIVRQAQITAEQAIATQLINGSSQYVLNVCDYESDEQDELLV